jgi:hypothetical protein
LALAPQVQQELDDFRQSLRAINGHVFIEAISVVRFVG